MSASFAMRCRQAPGVVRRRAMDGLRNCCGIVMRGSGWVARRFFAANSRAICKKSNAADRPSPPYYRSQGLGRPAIRITQHHSRRPAVSWAPQPLHCHATATELTRWRHRQLSQFRHGFNLPSPFNTQFSRHQRARARHHERPGFSWCGAAAVAYLALHCAGDGYHAGWLAL